jgi:hypothetical protein
MFKRREEIIQRNYEGWRKMHKSKNEEPPVGSRREWFSLHKDEMKMSYDQARNCMRLFSGTTKEVGEQLGVKKFKIISGAGLPESTKEKLITETVVKGLPSSKVKERVDEELKKINEFAV